ncbi:MAG TPA: MBL fold metallo-hydrolase [Candidatus Sulfomarinibacteraceae bacterium]|nr:MBL fold metallo-hydrolase [Candidatus Sulfomarinibacteraceae bacterium]
MARLELRARAVGPWPMNTYALVCPDTEESILIDPGAEPETLTTMLAGSDPAGIVLTHTHPDHVGALDEMRRRLDAPLLAHSGPHHEDMPLQTDRLLHDGDTFAVGRHTLRVIHAPGHIPDHICLALEGDDRMIVGDVVFEGGPGKTWTPQQFQTTLHTLRQIVLSWPDDTVCYPGHGPHFRLGDIRPRIEAFLAKDHGDFFGDATWEM